MKHPGEEDTPAVLSLGVEVARQRDGRDRGSLSAASQRILGQLETVHAIGRVSDREAVRVTASQLAALLVVKACSVC